MLKIKNKKAIYFRPVVVLILSLIFLVSIILIIFTIKKSMSEKAEETECIASIEAHISFIEAKYLAKDQVEETLGVASLFLPEFDQEAPEIKCPPKLIKSKANTIKEAEKEILKSALETWNLFKQGKALVYEDIKNKNFCFVLNVFEYNKNMNINLYERALNINANELISSLDSEKVLIHFYFESIENLDSHNFQMNCDSLIDSLFNDLEAASEVNSGNGAESYLSFSENLKFFEALIANNMVKDCSESKLGKLQRISNIVGHSVPVLNTDIPIAVIFIQNNVANGIPEPIKKVLSAFSIHEVPNFSHYYSSIKIIPYTQKNLKLIGCEELPIAFE